MNRFEKLRRTPRAITTEEVRKEQFAHHVRVQGVVKQLVPTSTLLESAAAYAAIGQEETYGVIRAYVQLIVLNEAEGNDWNFVMDAARADERLDDVDYKCHFLPHVQEMQRRVKRETVTPKEAEAGLAEMLMWQPELQSTVITEEMELQAAEMDAYLALDELEVRMLAEAQDKLAWMEGIADALERVIRATQKVTS